MKTLFTILAFTFLNLTVHAGQELDRFKQDVDTLFAAQKANPNQVISYADEKGYLVKAVLNPERFGRMIAESPSGFSDEEKYKETFEKFKPIINYFFVAFKQHHGKYDEEYFDSVEILFRISLEAARLVKKVSVNSSKTEESPALAESVVKTISQTPQLIVFGLAKDIFDGKFSLMYTPIAQKRIDTLWDKLRSLISQ